MTATTLSNRFAAAAFSLVVSATMLAYAIVPATPSLA
ncbi:enoyl-CoA hydratase [Erythrobacter sp.]|nr:enoyl-CoA hydratase [Erythrobacter sp.]